MGRETFSEEAGVILQDFEIKGVIFPGVVHICAKSKRKDKSPAWEEDVAERPKTALFVGQQGGSEVHQLQRPREVGMKGDRQHATRGEGQQGEARLLLKGITLVWTIAIFVKA